VKQIFSDSGSISYTHCIGSDTSGNCYVAGYFDKKAYFGDTVLLATKEDCFIAKYNSSGNLIWVKQIIANATLNSDANDFTDMVVEPNGDISLTGLLGGGMDFGNNITSQNKQPMVVKYHPDGHCVGIATANNAVGCGIDVDTSGNCYVAGSFSGNATFGNTTISSLGIYDLFWAKSGKITNIPPEHKGKTGNNKLIIYANPTTGKCNITVPDEYIDESNLKLYIYNMNGTLIQQASINIIDDKIGLDIEAEAKGVYNAILTNGSTSYMGKIVFE